MKSSKGPTPMMATQTGLEGVHVQAMFVVSLTAI